MNYNLCSMENIISFLRLIKNILVILKKLEASRK